MTSYESEKSNVSVSGGKKFIEFITKLGNSKHCYTFFLAKNDK